MKLIAVRHTKVGIETGICYGQADVPVAESFESECKIVREKLGNKNFDQIYSSPLIRCRQLAESLYSHQSINFDDRLKELNFGDWELKTWDKIYESEKGKVWMDNYQTLPTLNGESYQEMVSRVNEFLIEIKKSSFENVLVFAHAGVLRIIKSITENISIDTLFREFKPEYGEVVQFRIK